MHYIFLSPAFKYPTLCLSEKKLIRHLVKRQVELELQDRGRRSPLNSPCNFIVYCPMRLLLAAVAESPNEHHYPQTHKSLIKTTTTEYIAPSSPG